LQMTMHERSVVLSDFPDKALQTIRFRAVGFICSKDCFCDLRYLCYLHETFRDELAVVPIVADREFAFPTERELMRVNEWAKVKGLEGVKYPGAIMYPGEIVDGLFKIIAVYVDMHASQDMIETQTKTVEKRLAASKENSQTLKRGKSVGKEEAEPATGTAEPEEEGKPARTVSSFERI